VLDDYVAELVVSVVMLVNQLGGSIAVWRRANICLREKKQPKYWDRKSRGGSFGV
jgi:hypothetical protein